MARPVFKNGTTQVILGQGKVTSLQLAAGAAIQLFDGTANTFPKMTPPLIGGATGSVFAYPNGLDYREGVYASGSGDYVVGIAGAEYIGG